MTKNQIRLSIFSLMLVLFIDGLGQSIIFPLLTQTLTTNHHTMLFSAINPAHTNYWYGALVGAYYFMWFIFGPILGDWSDKIGRKKSLLICLTIACISFFLAGLAFSLADIWLLLLARLIGGAASGDQAIAKAAIIDICPAKDKAIYLGLVLFAITLGLILGPLLGSILIMPQFASTFGYSTPFIFATALAAINIFLIKHYFSETNMYSGKGKIKLLRSYHVFIDIFRWQSIRLLLLGYFLTQIGWQIFYVSTPLYVTKFFKFDEITMGTFLALFGVGLGIGLGLLPYLFRHYHNSRVAIGGYCILLLGIIIMTFANNAIVLWLIIIPLTSAFALAIANMLPIFSELVVKEKQGWIMGITGSIVALTGGIGALLTGPLFFIGRYMPFFTVIVFMLAGIVIFSMQLLVHQRQRHQPKQPD